MPYLTGGVLVGVDVDLTNLDPIRVFRGDFIENWRNHLARSAPLCPIVNQYRFVSLDNVLVEAAICRVNYAAHAMISTNLFNCMIV